MRKFLKKSKILTRNKIVTMLNKSVTMLNKMSLFSWTIPSRTTVPCPMKKFISAETE